jgi:hypothetical protein
MATLIPSVGTCASRMTRGERRVAERLEDKLDDDYLVWYDVPVGPHRAHPDFVVLHPHRGLLILEVKDWRLETIRHATPQTWEILAHGEPKTVINPIEQARHHAHRRSTGCGGSCSRRFGSALSSACSRTAKPMVTQPMPCRSCCG